jgi:endonuclease/exonuclease/phosphatase family metal-dependent hydrolase
MPDELLITDQPPEEVRKNLEELRVELDRKIPRTDPLDRNLLIATWNIMLFGDLTKKWRSVESDKVQRDYHSLHCITEIISRFNVVAIQEVRANLRALRYMLKLLGPNWGLLLTDVNKGHRGNWERLAFIFDRRKLQMSGLACEIVVPPEYIESKKIEPDALGRQFVRTPYAVAFRTLGTPEKPESKKTFILVTFHVIWGDRVGARESELKAIAKWLSEWANYTYAWNQNLIALGDFNIDRPTSARYKAFTSTGLHIPPDLKKAARTTTTNSTEAVYDQIAWFEGAGGTPALTLKYLRGGNFDFTKVALKNRGLTPEQLEPFISDHFPLWAEFQVYE